MADIGLEKRIERAISLPDTWRDCEPDTPGIGPTSFRQSALRQMLIDRLNAERQHGSRTRGSAFETLNALSKCRENRKGSGRAHVLVQLIGEMICSLFVLFMLKNQLESESRRDER